MTGREWKPGDVAMRTGPNGERDLSFVVHVRRGSGDCERNHGLDPHWHHSGGGWNTIPDDEKWGTYRPLVVIDPEDREQVERLRDAITAQMYGVDYVTTGDVEAALREFAHSTPPKPDEPTGLGAVVFASCKCEADSKRFVRDDTGSEWPEMPWKAGCGHHPWHELTVAANAVLSEGLPR